jgi:hypothetical protein
MRAGELAPLLREPDMEFCRLRDWDCGIESWRGRWPRARSAVVEGAVLPAMPPTVLILPAVMLRWLVLDEERWCRR